ncbi:hypothetical protein [Oribacterium sp. KHPX15]
MSGGVDSAVAAYLLKQEMFWKFIKASSTILSAREKVLVSRWDIPLM